MTAEEVVKAQHPDAYCKDNRDPAGVLTKRGGFNYSIIIGGVNVAHGSQARWAWAQAARYFRLMKK